MDRLAFPAKPIPQRSWPPAETTNNQFLLFEHGPDSQPAFFDAPVHVIEALEPQELPEAFAALERSRREGFWLAGYASYELGYVLEPRLRNLLPPVRRMPLLRFGVFNKPQPADRLNAEMDVAAPGAGLSRLQYCWGRKQYARAFDFIRAGIAAGNYYQVNLTMRLRMHAEGSALGLYSALRQRTPVEYGALVNLGAPTLLSLSPELFFEIDSERLISTQPMKGTAPRGETPAEDTRLRTSLQNDPKNRAENLMIVDLLRNDMSRICEPGSVRVPKLFEIKSYSTVHQMISRVESRLRDEIGICDIFTSLFPCGSVTGAPKIAAMEAIRAVEDGPREVYCGAIGWFAPDGCARFNVAIRTLLHFADDDVILNAGGGVVADSTADSEFDEAIWKTRFATALLRT